MAAKTIALTKLGELRNKDAMTFQIIQELEQRVNEYILEQASNVPVVQASGGSTLLFSQTADSTTTANVLTTLLGTGVGSLVIPANFFTPGRALRIRCGGVAASADTAAGVKTLALFLGGAAGVSGTSAGIFVPNAQPWYAEATYVCRTAGATGTMEGAGSWYVTSPTVDQRRLEGFIFASTTAVALDTRIQHTLDFQHDNGSVTGTLKTTYATVEALSF